TFAPYPTRRAQAETEFIGERLARSPRLTLLPFSAPLNPSPCVTHGWRVAPGHSMAEQYIFTIENLSKAYGKRQVLKNIWLAFYPGAKIGVIGSNGAGKSSLLRVMALAEKDFVGTARPADGITIGYVPQEPR